MSARKSNNSTAHWEKILAKEGLPADLEYNDILPTSLNRQIEQARVDFVDENDREPVDIFEIVDSVNCSNKSRWHAMGHYGLRITAEVIGEELIADVSTDPHELVSQKLLTEKLLDILLTHLSKREAGILLMRYGIADTEPLTYNAIGDIYGVSRNRIQQIEKRVFEEIRTDPELYRTLIDYILKEKDSDILDMDTASPYVPEVAQIKFADFMNKIYQYRYRSNHCSLDEAVELARNTLESLNDARNIMHQLSLRTAEESPQETFNGINIEHLGPLYERIYFIMKKLYTTKQEHHPKRAVFDDFY